MLAFGLGQEKLSDEDSFGLIPILLQAGFSLYKLFK
jgi:hypothetical protein